MLQVDTPLNMCGHFFFCIDTNSAFLILELQNNESTVSSQFPEKSQGWRWRLLMMRI